MSTDPEANAKPGTTPRRDRVSRRALQAVVGVAAVYLVCAYVIAPLAWRRYEKRHPALDDAPTIAHTATGIPGDPLNVGLISTDDQIHRAMLSAEWFPADPITL